MSSPLARRAAQDKLLSERRADEDRFVVEKRKSENKALELAREAEDVVYLEREAEKKLLRDFVASFGSAGSGLEASAHAATPRTGGAVAPPPVAATPEKKRKASGKASGGGAGSSGAPGGSSSSSSSSSSSASASAPKSAPPDADADVDVDKAVAFFEGEILRLIDSSCRTVQKGKPDAMRDEAVVDALRATIGTYVTWIETHHAAIVLKNAKIEEISESSAGTATQREWAEHFFSAHLPRKALDRLKSIERCLTLGDLFLTLPEIKKKIAAAQDREGKGVGGGPPSASDGGGAAPETSGPPAKKQRGRKGGKASEVVVEPPHQQRAVEEEEGLDVSAAIDALSEGQ